MDTYLPLIQMDIFSFILTFSQRWCILNNIYNLEHYDVSKPVLRLMLLWMYFSHLTHLSRWTSLSRWRWTSWMQRWRTAIKRRWVARGIKYFLVSGIFCSLLLLLLKVLTWAVNNIICLQIIGQSVNSRPHIRCVMSEKETICNLNFLDPATNDRWKTGWDAGQNSSQVNRRGKWILFLNIFTHFKIFRIYDCYI